jgi:nickel/cobalt transporter (NicO) family protein
MRPRWAVRALLALAAPAAVLAVAPAAMAHPLGNFTHNTYVGFTVEPDHIDVDHVLDLAEIPTYQERHVMDTNADNDVSASEAQAWGATRCAAAATEIAARTDDGPVTWVVGPSTVAFPAGQGGLPTTRLECAFAADVSGATTLAATVSVEDGRVGWHEVTAVGRGVLVDADVPSTSPSRRLTAYPVGTAPLDITTVRMDWSGDAVGALDDSSAATTAPTAPALAVTSIAPLGLDSAAQAFTGLISRQDLTFGFALLALAIAVLLGGLHAIAPGHGKTMMAASLVGTAGRRRDAVVLGASVTVAHTAGVVVLALALSVSSAIAAESVYPWLGLASGLFAIGVGVSLFRQARRGGLGHAHDHHAHDHHAHDHHAHDHPHHDHHAHDHHAHPHHAHAAVVVAAPPTPAPFIARPGSSDESERSRPGTRRFVALGLAGGMVPAPSAVVVLLAGFALGRSWFALLLVVAYGLGMALTLCLTGLLLVRMGGLSARLAAGTAVPGPIVALTRALPVIASVTVVVAGLWVGLRSILAM